jgi:diaminopimelate epimerase
MHGAGNDFVLIETEDDDRDWPGLARAICHRHYGIGADGILLLMPSDTAHFRMRIFNADGSESDICGNGLRCMVRYFLDSKPEAVTEKEIVVETRAGIRKTRLVQSRNGQTEIQASMGKPLFGAGDIPVREGKSRLGRYNIHYCSIPVFGRELTVHLVSMGNPHAVCFLDSPVGEFPLSETGPEITENEFFPNGINFEVVNFIDTGRLKARVWERGVGETLACGSGACAIAAIARCRGLTEDNVSITLPGGTLLCEWDGLGEILLSGPAETVFTGEWHYKGVIHESS